MVTGRNPLMHRHGMGILNLNAMGRKGCSRLSDALVDTRSLGKR